MVAVIKPAMEYQIFQVGRYLKDVLLEAKREGRITCGFYDTALVLESFPSRVLLCVLPQNHMDETDVHIHSMLIEAFCLENNIILLKIDNEEKMIQLLGESDFSANDFHCIGIKFPKGSSTLVDALIQYYKDLMHYCNYPRPIIELPV